MILRMPEYCKDFRCIASRCQDNCCIGWEIDIDPSSAEYYENVKGSFGDKLRDNIIKSDVCSFKLCGERCPFLNKNNLCEIIINLGEDKLCQICGDHPRFFEWYSHIKEGGIGLCCEEAARIIVPNKENFSTYDLLCDDVGCDDYNENLYNMLTFAREEIIKALEDNSLPLKTRLYSLMCYIFEIQYMADNYQFDKKPFSVLYPTEETAVNVKDFLESFKSLEAIDEGWEKYLSDLIDSSEVLQEKLSAFKTDFDLYLKNIAVYFIWRYFLKGVYDEEFLSKAMLAVISCAMIKLMYINEASKGIHLTEENLSLIAKRYSKEIEYSQENLDKIYDMAYENPSFSIQAILSLL